MRKDKTSLRITYAPSADDLKDGVKHIRYEMDMLNYSFEKLTRGNSNSSDESIKVDTTSTTDMTSCPSGGFTPLSPGYEEEKVSNVNLESFLLHVRNLREFFWGKRKPPRKDRIYCDVLASDYLPKWNREGDDKVECANPVYLCETRSSLDERLFHLTYSRAKLCEIDKRWKIKLMHKTLKNAWDVFYGNLPEDKRLWF